MRTYENKYSSKALLDSTQAEPEIANAAEHAMNRFQTEMEGAAAEAGISSEEDVVDLISQIRSEE